MPESKYPYSLGSRELTKGVSIEISKQLLGDLPRTMVTVEIVLGSLGSGIRPRSG